MERTVSDMKRHDWLTAAGWIGLIAGVMLFGLSFSGNELAPLARAYGVMLAASAVWLLGGLAIRARLNQHSVAVDSPKSVVLSVRRAR
jgi:hypothetical protein